MAIIVEKEARRDSLKKSTDEDRKLRRAILQETANIIDSSRDLRAAIVKRLDYVSPHVTKSDLDKFIRGK